MATEIERAYLAGIIDGEGNINIAYSIASKKTGRRHHWLQLNVTQNDIRLILWLQERFGGTIHQPKYFAQESWKPSNRITWAHGKAAEVLTEALPYMVVKKEQAEAAIAFRKTFMGLHLVSDEVLAEREGFRNRIKDLNKGLSA